MRELGHAVRQFGIDTWQALKATDPRVLILTAGLGAIALTVALNAAGVL